MSVNIAHTYIRGNFWQKAQVIRKIRKDFLLQGIQTKPQKKLVRGTKSMAVVVGGSRVHEPCFTCPPDVLQKTQEIV